MGTKRLKAAALFLSLAAVSCLSGAVSARGRIPFYASPRRLDSAIEDIRVELEDALGKIVPSLSVLIQAGENIYFTSSKSPGAREVTPDTYFRFASNTKNFTATAILKMHQDGWIDYKDFIVDAIPGTGIPYVPDNSCWDIPYKESITVKGLLRHTAGVYDVDNDEVPGCGGLSYVEYTLGKNPSHQFSSEELVKQNVLHNLYYFPPEDDYNYSNTGYTILSEIISRVYTLKSGAQKNFKDYLYDHVYGPSSPVPLDIGFPFQAEDITLPEPSVCGKIYRAPDGEAAIYCLINMSAHVAEGNGYGTMKQLNRYIRSLIRGENVLSGESARKMKRDVSTHNPAYGLGCFNIRNLGYGHNGAIYGNLSLMVYDPDFDVSVIVLLPMWDETAGMESMALCFQTLNEAGWAAREALGYPGRKESGCVIATSVYRSKSSGEVKILRKFRNNVLRKNNPGQILLRTYYLAAPRAAGPLEENSWLRFIVRTHLAPMVRIAGKM